MVDLAEAAIMDSYRVYERKNGRFALPLDNVEEIIGQLESTGLMVQG